MIYYTWYICFCDFKKEVSMTNKISHAKSKVEGEEGKFIWCEQLDKSEYDSKYKGLLGCKNGCEARIKFTQRKNNVKFFSTWNKEGNLHKEKCPYHVDYKGKIGRAKLEAFYQSIELDDETILRRLKDKMEKLLQKNPGLRSRIAFHVPFADYDSKELCQIADMISKKNGMKIDNNALDKLEKVFDIAKADEDFGNGRYARNIFEQAKMNQASRLLEKDFENITADEITTITADDIIIPETKKCEKRRIGF